MTVQPIGFKTSTANLASPCNELDPMFGIVIVVPVMAAKASGYVDDEASDSITKTSGAVATEVKNLDAVPALPRYNSLSEATKLPPLPFKIKVSPWSSQVISAPFKFEIAFSICSTSSECSKFLILQGFDDKAAKTKALFEMDFEPGGVITSLKDDEF
ncbi:hypothetical protein WICMUC_005945 [Wickerhamomyces mucosus]|uniref:Uncharacterized protein n=1 Tax=Wickerhamomyces mucosus TaxID=1378264 RepID=A0A9P8P2D1_9ASCO|nr:hypothetical protein WICMUC_005945 [Wickerhamomyces mucosus]